MILHDRGGTEKCVIPENALVYESRSFRLYRALSLDQTQNYLLRIPRDATLNGEIDAEAETLKHLASCSAEIEAEYAESKHDPSARVHYDWLFPQLVDTFILDESQGYRQANLLSVIDGNIAEFYPLPKLMNAYRVDAKTAAWVLGRFFKLQTFLESVDVTLNFRADQVLVEPKMHRVVYLGWCLMGNGKSSDCGKLAARTILGWQENNGTEHEDDFRNLLEKIADPSQTRLDGVNLHQMLYGNLVTWWGRNYHPFTYLDRASRQWKQLEATL